MENNNEDCEMLSVRELPPGFRFDPTDEELILHFLFSKYKQSSSSSSSFPLCDHHTLIPDLENFYQPTQLHGEAFESYGKWYFYTRKSDKRITENGYWKEMGTDQPIFARSSTSNKIVGIKKSLIFYEGKFPSGLKTRWFMQEYHLRNNTFSTSEITHRKKRRALHRGVKEWVVCRVQQSCDELSDQLMSTFVEDNDASDKAELSSLDELFLALTSEHFEETSYP